MATLATLLVKVGVDASGVDKQATGIQKRLFGIGRVASATVTPALALLGNVAVNAASDLGESVNAIEQVFGPAAKQIKAFGQTADETVGLSTRAFNELVTPVGAALQNVGFSADEAAGASINLAERAADMASVFNVDVSDALGAIQAGLRGEADPLERFGVGLSAAAVQAHALETGLIDTDRELTANEKAQARLSLLMAQTDKIAGDFANTADSVANSERIAAAEAENMAASFGQQLLPVKAQLIDILRNVLAAFNGLSPSMQKVILTVAAVAAAIGPLLLVGLQVVKLGGALAGVFRLVGVAFRILTAIMMTNPWLLVAAAIIALVVVVVKNWDTIKNVISKAWNAIKKVTSAVWDAIVGFLRKNWKIILAVITGPLGALMILIASNWNKIKSTTSRVWNSVVSFIRGIPGRVVSAIRSLISRVRGVMNDVWNGARRATIGKVNSLISFVRGIPGKIRRAIPNPAGLLRSIGRSIIQGLINGLTSKLAAVRDLASSIGGFIKDLKGPERKDRKLLVPEGAAIIEGLIGGLESQLPGLGRLVAGIGGQIQGDFGVDALTSRARVAAPAPGGPTRVTFDFTGIDSEMAKAIRKTVRVEGGGDVQEAFGVS